ncbi:MAG TPA: glycosyltransferase [bacterium]|nr:glycosyltransferase [bacterium]
MTTRVCTVHPFDPWGSKIGGIETLIRTMLCHAPEDFGMEVAGVTEHPVERPARRRQSYPFCDREIRFYPVFTVKNPNRRTRFPLFLQFPLRLRFTRLDLRETVAVYHRIEPLYLSPSPARANILFIHGHPREITGPTSEVRWRHVPRLYQAVEARAIRRADRIFVISRAGTAWLQERYPEKKDCISFLETWYNDAVFQLAAEGERERARLAFARRFNLDPAGRFVLFAGRWEAQKNPQLAIEAFARIAPGRPSLHLLLAGSGGLEKAMRETVNERGMTGRIHLIGPLAAPELAAVMGFCDTLLVSSSFEGMPILVLEALACGLPVVSTAAGEIRQVVEEGVTGVVCAEQTPESLARALEMMLEHIIPETREACSQAAASCGPKARLPGLYEVFRELGEDQPAAPKAK